MTKAVEFSETDIHLLYRLTWYATDYSVDREVNNGRGPVDFKISKGSKDATLVEFKLAKNSKLKQNLEKQLEIYKKANNTEKGIKVIFYHYFFVKFFYHFLPSFFAHFNALFGAQQNHRFHFQRQIVAIFYIA